MFGALFAKISWAASHPLILESYIKFGHLKLHLPLLLGDLSFFLSCQLPLNIDWQSCFVLFHILFHIFQSMFQLQTKAFINKVFSFKSHCLQTKSLHAHLEKLAFSFCVVLVLLIYVHGKHLRSCRDGQ